MPEHGSCNLILKCLKQERQIIYLPRKQIENNLESKKRKKEVLSEGNMSG